MPEPTDRHPALVLLGELLNVPSPSGREEQVAAIVREKLDGMGYAHETDPAGNVVARVAGRDSDAGAMVLAAHMDEIGMVVQAIDADGSLRVARSGGLYPYKLGEGPVDIVGDAGTVTGVLSMGSTHTADAATRSVTWDSVRVLTGLSPKQLGEAGVRVGSTAVPTRAARGPVVFGDPADPLVAAWTFDDRMGVVALLRLLESMKEERITPARDTLVAFTVHEEGGCHGAKVLAARERPEIFIAVDGCPMPPGTDLTLDGRPGTWSMDTKVHYDQCLVRGLCDAAREAGTELQVAVLPHAFSDASAVYDAGAAPRVAIVGQVRENSHGYEVARLSVFDRLRDTLVQFVRAFE